MGGEPRGRKSRRRRCGLGDRGAAGLRPDQSIKRQRCVRALNSSSGEEVADVGCPPQDIDGFRCRERNRGVEKSGSCVSEPPRLRGSNPPSCGAVRWVGRVVASMGGGVRSRSQCRDLTTPDRDYRRSTMRGAIQPRRVAAVSRLRLIRGRPVPPQREGLSEHRSARLALLWQISLAFGIFRIPETRFA